MITVNGLKITFNPGTPLENQALKGIDLRIPDGQFMTVIGSNGAGKSTFLNTLAGECLSPTSSIILDDKDISAWPVEKRASLIARVFQDPLMGTCEDLTIEENLALAQARIKTRGLDIAAKRQYRNRFRNKLKLLQLGLEDRLNDKIGLRSSGQRQAVSLLMASLQPMKLLLLDGHIAALEPKTGNFILKLTEEIVNESKLTALMVTHIMNQALVVGSRKLCCTRENRFRCRR